MIEARGILGEYQITFEISSSRDKITMKKLLFSLPILATFALAAGSATDARLSLSISIPAKNGEHVLDPARVPRFHVILSNISDIPQRVWAPWSEASYRTLSFEFKDATGKAWKAQPKEWESVSHKLPEVCILQPGESLVFEIDYTNANAWENFPKAAPDDSQISMQATYEIRSDPAPEVNRVWTGKVVSKPLKIAIHPR